MSELTYVVDQSDLKDHYCKVAESYDDYYLELDQACNLITLWLILAEGLGASQKKYSNSPD